MSLSSAKTSEATYPAPVVPLKSPTINAQNNERYLTTGYLPAPLSGPIRPLSPDTLSIFSADEYDQIRPGRSTTATQIETVRLRDFSCSPVPTPRLRAWRARLAASWVRDKALFYMLGAQVFGCLMNVTTRLLEIEGNKGKGLHPFQILFARMGITAVLASAYMYSRKTPHFPFGAREVRWLLVARGFFGFFGVVGMYWSLLYLPLADATVITFLSPALACFACSILLKEPFTRIERIAAIVSLVGVVLIAHPTTLFGIGGSASPKVPASGNTDVSPPGSVADSDASSYDDVTPEERLFAVGIALVGVMGAAIVITIIRWIGRRAHPLISVNYFATWCTFISLIAQFVVPGVGFLLPADLKDWSYLFFLGICGFIMFFLASALSYENSSRATNITYTQMLFALGFDKLIFGNTPGLMSIIGSSLILGAAIVVAMQRSSVQKAPLDAEDEYDDMERSGTDGIGELQLAPDGAIRGEVQIPVRIQDVQLRSLG